MTKRENEVMKYIRRSIEENGILHPIEIKKNSRVKAEMTSAFQALDAIPDKKRGMGALNR